MSGWGGAGQTHGGVKSRGGGGRGTGRVERGRIRSGRSSIARNERPVGEIIMILLRAAVVSEE